MNYQTLIPDLNYCLAGDKICQSKAHSASLRDFVFHQNLTLENSARYFPRFRPLA